MVVDILTLLIMYYSIQETWNSVSAKNVQFDGWTGMEVFPPHIDRYILFMLMIFGVIIYVIKMQFKHVIISNLTNDFY